MRVAVRDQLEAKMISRQGSATIAICAALALSACGGGGGEDLEPVPQGPSHRTTGDSVFGEGGLTLGNIGSGGAFGLGGDESGGSMPVNRFLWQASLDTLSFLPLASTDPFTGVIATDWGAAPGRADERFKVTTYMLSPALAASSVKVAVYREVRSPEGAWVPAAVDPETPRKLEDAILTRARQIRIADVEGTTTG